MAGDPLWSSVDLLLPCDDATAPPVDVSPVPRSSSLQGTPAPTMSSVVGKFSGSMNGTTGTGRFRYAVPTSAFAGDFTVEAWIYRGTTWGLFANRHWFGAGNDGASGSNDGFTFRIANISGTGYQAQVITRSSAGNLNQMVGPVVPASTWTHVCIEVHGA